MECPAAARKRYSAERREHGNSFSTSFAASPEQASRLISSIASETILSGEANLRVDFLMTTVDGWFSVGVPESGV